MKAAMRKFDIETEFSETGEILRDSGGARRYLTPEELSKARDEAYAAGQSSELSRAEMRKTAALEAIAAACSALMQSLTREKHAAQRDAADLALAIARTVAGAALESFGADRVRAAILEALEAAPAAPRVIVRLSPSLAEELLPELESLADRAGFVGALIGRIDPAVAAFDCRIEWSDGAVSLSAEETLARAEAILRERMMDLKETVA
jgi:flagellar assembly protein FliH